MLIKPNQNWHWIFDTDKGLMTLELGEEMLFVSKLTKKRCVPHAREDAPFCTEHAELYYQYLDQLDAYDWSAPIKVQIVLNAIAIAQYHKPMMPQSWFFTPLAQAEQQLELGELVVLQSEHQQARFMLLEQNQQTMTLMLIDGQMQLDASKQLQQFEAIKVMRDRAMAMSALQQKQLAQAG